MLYILEEHRIIRLTSIHFAEAPIPSYAGELFIYLFSIPLGLLFSAAIYFSSILFVGKGVKTFLSGRYLSHPPTRNETTGLWPHVYGIGAS